jgi:NADH-quinone oxidoreductase subunit G
MIEETGLQFNNLQPESMDMPMGFKTGAGIIFGASGGVTEAVLRYAAEKITGIHLDNVEFEEVRGEKGLREAAVTLGDITLKLAVVHGLKNARTLADAILSGQKHYDLVEVMACPGGCIGGAGQPVSDTPGMARKQRTQGLFNVDRMLQLHKSQENHLVAECYEKHLGEIGGHKAHKLLHTKYHNRRRIDDAAISLTEGGAGRLVVSVCVGTSCFIKGSQELLRRISAYVEQQKLSHLVDVQATFCLERCSTAPNAMVGDVLVEKAKFDSLVAELTEQLKATATP